jgi:hypothetical protein
MFRARLGQKRNFHLTAHNVRYNRNMVATSEQQQQQEENSDFSERMNFITTTACTVESRMGKFM